MNNKQVRQGVQDRDAGGTVEKPAIHWRNEGTFGSGVDWKPRADDRGARLVNERATVFDRPSPALAPVDPLLKISDPVWDDHQGTVWTPNLVHARLRLTGEVIDRMPGPLQRSYRSILGAIADGLTPSSGNKAPPTPQEITIADWTLVEIMKRAHRGVLLASAWGLSGDKIAEQMQRLGRKMAGSTVQDLYLKERRVMAGQWQARRVPVDGLTNEKAAMLFPRRN